MRSRFIGPLSIACVMFTSGCMFGKLNDDLKWLDAAVDIQGNITSTLTDEGPIFIALYEEVEPGDYRLSKYRIRFGTGPFSFLVPPGKYYLFAFEDTNEDFTFQASEYVGWYGGPTLIQAEPGTQLTDVDVRLRPPDKARLELPEIYARDTPVATMQLDSIELGEVVGLDDPRFSRAAGTLGLWQPVRFMQEGDGGLFFLEPYDPDRIPILFVHGMGGFAGEWRPIIEHLDTDRFQPWVVQYPSGLRLDLLSQRLSNAVRELKIKYRLHTLFVVAHSMGGLLSRGFIQRYIDEGDTDLIGLFVTLSTPWQGHASAQRGVSRAPAVIPAWYDMVPDSPYIRSLFENTGPDCFPYYLLFSYRGTRGFLPGENSDGTVTLRSQLAPVAQDEAEKIFGFDEGHVGILNGAGVFARLNTIFSQTADQRASDGQSCRERAERRIDD